MHRLLRTMVTVDNTSPGHLRFQTGISENEQTILISILKQTNRLIWWWTGMSRRSSVTRIVEYAILVPFQVANCSFLILEICYLHCLSSLPLSTIVLFLFSSASPSTLSSYRWMRSFLDNINALHTRRHIQIYRIRNRYFPSWKIVITLRAVNIISCTWRCTSQTQIASSFS